MMGKGAVAQPEALSVSPHEAWMERLRHITGVLFDHPRTTASVAAVGVLLCGWAIWKAVSPSPTPTPYQEPKPPSVAEITPAPNLKSDGKPPAGLLANITPAPFIPGPNPPNRTPGADNWVPNFTPDPAAATAIDPKLVGTWSARIKISATGYVVWHWEQAADGHYSSTVAGGPIIDAGTLTAQDGNIRRVSAVRHVTEDLTYEIKSANEIVVNDPNNPNGPLSWKRVGTGTGSKTGTTTTRSKGNSGDSGTHHSTDWQQYIPRNAPSHGIPHLPF
jgi:hypothetical protein